MKPMETAPRDGSDVLVMMDDGKWAMLAWTDPYGWMPAGLPDSWADTKPRQEPVGWVPIEPMNEQRAREILGAILKDDGMLLLDDRDRGVLWTPTPVSGPATVSVDGDFTAEELEAIAWWMRTHGA